MVNMDWNADGLCSWEEFQKWYYKWSVPDTPYDVLFAKYTPDSYWWFVQVMWLKLLINLLFTVKDQPARLALSVQLGPWDLTRLVLSA
jgi:hypothetical protein